MHSILHLETTAYTIDQIISLEQPHIAIAGRSNVGKSSLVNALAMRKALAKVSATPGKTRSINFYRVEPDNFYLVDLPGYGYARCSKQEREKWGILMQKYLLHSKSLKAMMILLDCRLPPQKIDIQLAQFAKDNAIALLPVLTKADKCSQRERAERQSTWAALLNNVHPIITSAQTRLGMDTLWHALRERAGAAQ